MNFGGTYFRNIYSSVNDKFYKNSWEVLTKNFIVVVIMISV